MADALDGRRVILDGELVACPGGKVDVYSLAPRMTHTGRAARFAAEHVPVTYVAFDILHLDGRDLTARPLLERKQLLDGLGLVGPAWATNGWHRGDGETMFQMCLELGHEGVVAKRLDSTYQPGKRNRFWLKRKSPAWARDHAPCRRPGVRA
jgi:bifunctional non-homologous end joining protein LigD